MTREEPETMRQQRGFSLVELIVAMTVTLIVSSAIYGLLSAGGSAFRREPELADRQQNIRAAMDLIARDVYSAGASLPTFAQVFTRNDPAGACAGSLNSCGTAGTMGPAAAGLRLDDEDVDVLEMVSTDEQCPFQTVCSAAPVGGSLGLFVTRERVPQCAFPGLALLTDNALFAVQAVTGAAGAAACLGPPAGASPPNGNLTLTAGLAPWNAALPPAAAATPNIFLYRARLVRYRVAPNTDPMDTLPSLWRTESGRFDPADGLVIPEPGDPGFVAGGSPWQLVARGIEDLQVEYLDGNGAWQNQPPVSLVNNWATLVRRVRITLSARVGVANLGGETAGGGGAPIAVRGQLSTVVAPRPAFFELQMCASAVPPCTLAERIQ
jgi:prepilin-type N-terminal cleavage/methylation domain-containing protein